MPIFSTKTPDPFILTWRRRGPLRGLLEGCCRGVPPGTRNRFGQASFPLRGVLHFWRYLPGQVPQREGQTHPGLRTEGRCIGSVAALGGRVAQPQRSDGRDTARTPRPSLAFRASHLAGRNALKDGEAAGTADRDVKTGSCFGWDWNAPGARRRGPAWPRGPARAGRRCPRNPSRRRGHPWRG